MRSINQLRIRDEILKRFANVLASIKRPESSGKAIRGTKPVKESNCLIKQLADEISFPESGKQSVVLLDNSKTKVVLFTFAAGGGLAEHVAPFDATIQIIAGMAALTVGDESVEGKPGTWIQMVAKTPHSIKAESPVAMLLTLVK